MAFEIYTDGSAVARKSHPDYRKGGTGVCFFSNGKEVRRFSRGFYPTKTGRQELYGILFALKLLAKDQEAIIFSDSMYCINCFSKQWLRTWEMQGWPPRIKSKDLLKDILEEYRKFPKGAIQFRHVKGHTGVLGNEIADELASYKNHEYFYDDSIWLGE